MILHQLNQLKNCFAVGNKRTVRAKARVLVLLDWENLQQNVGFVPGGLSLKDRLDACIRQIAKQVGSIVDVFVFMPPHASHIWGEQLYKAGFFILVCPKIKNKAGDEVDTTDETLIRFGERMLDELEGLTHLCLGSGDIDFSPLLIRARRKGLKNVLIAGDPRSLSAKMGPLLDLKPYFLSLECSNN